MRRPPTFMGGVCAAVVAGAMVIACGSTKIPQMPSSSPFLASSVTVAQQGNANVTIELSTVTFTLDDTGSLVVRFSVRSNARTTTTVTVRGSLYDPKHQLVGDVTGGAVAIPPRAVVPIELNGPTPLGTIASATFETTVQPETG